MQTPPSAIEPLESRIAPAVFTVTSVADSGAGTLRQAILDANALLGADSIAFDLPGSDVRTIAPTTPLPQITDTLTVDGSTQPGYNPESRIPLIELSGVNAGAGAVGLDFQAATSGVVALTINRFTNSGVLLAGTSDFVSACFIGTTPTGLAAAPNGVGITVTGVSALVGSSLGNIVSGNTGAGVHLTSSASGATVGNVTAAEANLIAGNGGAGIVLQSAAGANAILINRFFNNGGLAIDLFNDGVTPNDFDSHVNFPVIKEVFSSSSGTYVRGQYSGAANTEYSLHFYSAFTPDPSGYGEGRDFFGNATVLTNDEGLAEFDFLFPTQVVANGYVTALANHGANSSEFALSRQAAPGNVALTIASNGRTATFQDVDGDTVSVRVNKGLLNASYFTLVPAGTLGGGLLQGIDIAGHAELSGADLTITAKRGPRGDGFVNVGYVDATDIDLGNVSIAGDLGRLRVGESIVTPLALRSLTVQSLGSLGFTNQGASGSLLTNIDGNATSITVRGNVSTAFIDVIGDLGSLSIGNNLLGAGADNAGTIRVAGTLAKLRIGGSIIGGEAINSGAILAGKFGEATILGSILGGSAEASGLLNAGIGGIGKLTIGKSIIGNPLLETAAFNGVVFSLGPINSISLGGSLIGGASIKSGYVEGVGIGTLTIGGSLRGGDGLGSGSVYSATETDSDPLPGFIRTVKVSGSLFGGPGVSSGSITADQHINSVTVTGSLFGSAGDSSGAIVVGGNLVSAKIGGSLEGSSGPTSGTLVAFGTIGSVRIGGDAHGAALPGRASDSGSIMSYGAGRVASVQVLGDMLSTLDSGGTFGTVKIGGGFSGLLAVLGNQNPTTRTAATALASLTIGGDASGAVFAGFSPVSGWTHSNVIIGPVTIGGSITGLSISAGVQAGINGRLADDDDLLAVSGSSIPSEIVSILVHGPIYGLPALTVHHGFTAQHIGKLQIGATKFALTTGTDRFDLGDLRNVSLREV